MTINTLQSAFQVISTNDLDLIRQHLDGLSPYLVQTLDVRQKRDNFNNFTWHNAGGTFLHIENLSVPVARFLLKIIAQKSGIEQRRSVMERFVNVNNARHESVLHIAAETGNVQMMLLLLGYGGEIYARNANGQTPLHCAVSYDGSKYSEANAVMSVFILTRHEEETSANNTKINIYEDVQYTDLRDKFGNTALKIAQDRNGNNLVTALEFCRTRCTIEHELMQNIRGARQREFPKEKYVEIIGALAHHGRVSVTFKKDAHGMTVVHLACLYGLDFILENLFRFFSVKIRVLDNYGRTPLHCAVLSENLEGGHKCLDILLREDQTNSKSVKDVKDHNGKTALRIALERNLTPACTSMLAYGCDIYGESWANLVELKSKKSRLEQDNQDLLFQIYKKMPSTIVHYLNSCAGFIDYSKELPKSEQQIIAQDTPCQNKQSELFYTFSPLIGLNNYILLTSTDKSCGLKEEMTYLINVLKFSSLADKSLVMNHPLVKLFIELKWKKLRWMFYTYQIISLLMLLLYSWFIFDVYTVWCPFKGMNSTNTDRSISFRGFNFNGDYDRGEDFHHHPFYERGYTPTPTQAPLFAPRTALPLSTTTTTPGFVEPWFNEGGSGTMTCVPMYSKFVAIALLAYSVYIILKELFQLYHRDIFYGYKTKVWQLAEGTLMAINCGSIFLIRGDDLDDWRYTTAGFGLCISWIAVIHQIGKIPQAGKYVAVLKTVTKRSIWLILAFVPLLIAFTFTFKILLPGNPQFKFLPTAFVKSMVMMSGELDYIDFFYNPQNVIRSPCSLIIVQIFFGLFIFIMPIILLNLLIGLAVTEIKGVVQQGRIHHLLAQLQQIAIMEKILFWIARKCRKMFGGLTCKWIVNFLVVDKIHVNSTVCNKHKSSWTMDFYSNAEIPQEKLRVKIREICQKSYYSSHF